MCGIITLNYIKNSSIVLMHNTMHCKYVLAKYQIFFVIEKEGKKGGF